MHLNSLSDPQSSHGNLEKQFVMKLAFSTNAFKNYSLDEAISIISKLGYDGVEILCDIPHAYPRDMSESRIIDIQSLISKKGIAVSNLNAFTLYATGDLYHPSWIEADLEQRSLRIKHTIECVKMAAKLGSKNVSTEPGGPITSSSPKREQLLKTFVDSLTEVVPIAEKERVKILIEPEPELLIQNSQEFIELMGMIESPCIKLNFDIGHFFCVGEDLSKTIYKLADYIEHFHIEDISKERIHKHLLPGEGVIDFKSVFRTIRDIGFDGYATVELYPYQECPEHVAIKSIEFLNGLIY